MSYKNTCSVDGCDDPIRSYGWCNRHYYRWYRHGDPERTKRMPPGLTLVEKFEFKGWDVTDTGCWEWRGRRNRDGYGLLKHDGWWQGAHRLAYIAWVGPIDDGLKILHSCDNPPCINPDHLRQGTQADNVADAVSRNRQRSSRKLQWSEVGEIRNRYSQGSTQRELEDEFGLASGTVSRIMSGQLYRLEY